VVAGRPVPAEGEEPTADYRLVTPGYFRAMGIPLLRGRGFRPEDAGDAAPVVVVNESFARSVWGGRDPVGRRITVGGLPDVWGEVVGVVRDVQHTGLDRGRGPEMYWLYSQGWVDSSQTLRRSRRKMSLVIRGAGEPSALVGMVRRALLDVDGGEAVSGMRTMEDLVDASLAPRWFQLLLLGQLAALALTLAALGIYGAVAYAVGERTRELGVRVALGASPPAIRRLVLGQGAWLAGLGLAIGAICAIAATRALSSFLFEVGSTDPVTYVAVAALLAAVTLLACYVPVRRATRLDPAAALRRE
jgi:predicted permease